MDSYRNFKGESWKKNIDLEDFIKSNYTLYEGDESFLEGTTEKTDKVWNRCKKLIQEELEREYLM